MKAYRLALTTTFLLPMISMGASFDRYDSSRKVVWVSNFQNPAIETDEPVCAYEGKKLIGCGLVTSNSGGLLGINVPQLHYLPQPKTLVAVTRGDRAVSSVSKTETRTYLQPKTISISGGVVTGFNYYYPNMHIQLAPAESWSLGIQPMFASYSHDDSSITGYGAYLTASYYYTHSAFKGVIFEGGIGLFNVKGKAGVVEDTQSALGAKLTAGWRGRALWDLGLDLGVEGGVQYIGFDSNKIEISFQGVVPMLSCYIGYSF